MASYATWDTNTSRYVLGPVLQWWRRRKFFRRTKPSTLTFELTLLALGLGDGASMAGTS